MNIDVQKSRLLPPTSVIFATVAVALAAIALAALGYLPVTNAALLLPFIFGLYGLTAVADSNKIALAAILITTFLIGFFMAIYRPVGFNYPLAWSPGSLHEGGNPFSLYVNLSKAIGGYLVIIWLMMSMRSHERASLRQRSVLGQSSLVLAGAGSILLVAHTLFGVGWQPKLPDGLLYFVLVNLLVTVVSEEAFFRLLLQHQIERFFRNKQVGVYVGVAIAAVLFALAHSGATGMAFFLFLLAGLVYAAVYARTRSLLASIATHFGVNIAHITLLEYPL